MPRWLLWTPIAALTVVTALVGLRAGWLHSNLNESDVINRAAQSYLQGGQGRRPSDCSAQPARTQGLWLVVTCVSVTGAQEIYHATRGGDLRLGGGVMHQPEA